MLYYCCTGPMTYGVPSDSTKKLDPAPATCDPPIELESVLFRAVRELPCHPYSLIEVKCGFRFNATRRIPPTAAAWSRWLVLCPGRINFQRNDGSNRAIIESNIKALKEFFPNEANRGTWWQFGGSANETKVRNPVVRHEGHAKPFAPPAVVKRE